MGQAGGETGRHRDHETGESCFKVLTNGMLLCGVIHRSGRSSAAETVSMRFRKPGLEKPLWAGSN